MPQGICLKWSGVMHRQKKRACSYVGLGAVQYIYVSGHQFELERSQTTQMYLWQDLKTIHKN